MDRSAARAVAEGLLNLVVAGIDFALLPTAVGAVAVACAGIRPRTLAHPAGTADRLLWRIVLIGFLLVAALVLGSGATIVRDRWLLPALFLLPMASAAWVDGLGRGGRTAQNVLIGAGIAAALLAAPGTWYVQLFGGSGMTGTLRMDYRALYRDLTADGPVATVAASESWIGNLRLVAKDVVLLNEEVPSFATLLKDPVVLVWLGDSAPTDILRRLRQAGYAPVGDVRTLTVPERMGGPGRSVSFVRAVKQDAAKRSAPLSGREAASAAPQG
jgi:hypothetical protein